MSAEFFERLFNTVDNAYMVLDRQLRFVAANDTYCEVTNSSRETLLGTQIFESFPDDPNDANSANRKVLDESFKRVLATGKPDFIAYLPYRVMTRTATGAMELTQRVWSATHLPMFGADGSVEFIVQHTTDISDLSGQGADSATGKGVLDRAKKVSETNNLLRFEQDFLRQLFEQAPGFVAVLRGKEHVFEIANPAYLELIGRTNIIGKTVEEALPEIARQGFIALLDNTFKSGTPYIGRGVRVMLLRNGHQEEREIDFTYQPLLEEGRSVGIFVIGTDVTESRTLIEERDRLVDENRFVTDTLPIQLWSAAPTGELTSVNRAVEQYVAKPSEQILTEGWMALIHPDDLPTAVPGYVAGLQSGVAFEQEFRLKRADGSWRWHISRIAPLRDDGVIVKWVGSNVDIEELKHFQLELQRLVGQLEIKNRELNRFAYVASHDLKTPLRGIANLARWIADDLVGDQNDDVKKNLKLLEGRVVRMHQLVEGILSYSRSLEGQDVISAIDTDELVNEVVAMVAPPAGTVVEVQGPLPKLRGSRAAISQVVMNLIGNAMKHAGGRIVVRGSEQGGTARIEVVDDGPGIAPQHHDRIWELFQTLSPESAGNTGIGLSIVRRIIEAQGGHVGVESQLGKGATFFFTLPKAPA